MVYDKRSVNCNGDKKVALITFHFIDNVGPVTKMTKNRGNDSLSSSPFFYQCSYQEITNSGQLRKVEPNNNMAIINSKDNMEEGNLITIIIMIETKLTFNGWKRINLQLLIRHGL